MYAKLELTKISPELYKATCERCQILRYIGKIAEKKHSTHIELNISNIENNIRVKNNIKFDGKCKTGISLTLLFAKHNTKLTLGTNK